MLNFDLELGPAYLAMGIAFIALAALRGVDALSRRRARNRAAALREHFEDDVGAE